MKPVDQTILGKGEEALRRGEEPGDCLRACVASILEQPIEKVPNFAFTGPEDPYKLWWWAMIGWCSVYGWELVTVVPKWTGKANPNRGYSIQGGPGPRGHNHVVVAHQGVMVHDPHPDRSGLLQCTVEWELRPA